MRPKINRQIWKWEIVDPDHPNQSRAFQGTRAVSDTPEVPPSPSCLPKEVLQCEKKGDNHLVLGPDYMIDALKLHNQTPRGYGELLQKYVFWRCPDGTQQLFCWSILAICGQSLALNSPVVNNRYMNLVFGHAEATLNKRFLSSPTKYTVESSWPLVLVWSQIELLHRTLTTIVFTQYCRM
ncbi:hypothetical protein TNCV_1991451 [Trichonephila clavipes]|nr:hypothetical protein TNCV_1991451 [Trichonephila clavipes]